MPIEVRRIPAPTAEAGVDPGDLVVMTTNNCSELGLIAEGANGRKLILVLATLAGDPDEDGVPRITSPGGNLCKIVGEVIIRPPPAKSICVEGDPSSGALTMTPDGAYVRVEQHRELGYIDINTGKFAEPATPRAYYEQWSLAFDGPDERIFATVLAKAKK